MSDLSLNVQKKELAHGSKDTFPSTKHRFKKGQSGNPAGRPHGVTKAYTAMLKEIDPKTGKTNAELIAEAQLEIAKSQLPHSVSAAKEIRQATEGTDETSSVGNLNKEVLRMMIEIASEMKRGEIIEGDYEKVAQQSLDK